MYTRSCINEHTCFQIRPPRQTRTYCTQIYKCIRVHKRALHRHAYGILSTQTHTAATNKHAHLELRTHTYRYILVHTHKHLHVLTPLQEHPLGCMEPIPGRTLNYSIPDRVVWQTGQRLHSHKQNADLHMSHQWNIPSSEENESFSGKRNSPLDTNSRAPLN